MKRNNGVFLDGRRVDLIIVDAMFTLFVPKKTDRLNLIGRIYREHARVSSQKFPNRAIREKLQELRKVSETLKTITDDEVYWRFINTEMLLWMGSRQHSLARGQNTRSEIIGTPGHYKVPRPLRRFVRRMRENGVRVVVGSNHRRVELNKMMRYFNLHNSFDAVYSSQDLGDIKPHQEFWKKILEQEGISVENVIHIGNSVRSDTGAGQLGIRVFLINRGEELIGFSQSDYDFSQLNLPELLIELIKRLLDQGLLSVHSNIAEIRDRYLEIRPT